ncbi:hypothetical protein MKW92_040522 [Papaver armeniacum]|nr:hypothetical protein MKW92_040522 [Papaver armeniacum]
MPLFWPWETYKAGESLDLSKHHIIRTFLDKFAFKTVKTSENFDISFSRRYGCWAMMLETVAVSLLQFQHTGGWIKSLLGEAENERMHLMTTVDPVKLIWYERFWFSPSKESLSMPSSLFICFHLSFLVELPVIWRR